MNAFADYLDKSRQEKLRELWLHWARKPMLTLHEASALLSGIIPSGQWKFDDVFRQRISFGEDLNNRYLRNHDLLMTERTAGNFGYLVPIEKLLAWARYNGVSIDLNFAAAVLEIDAHREKVRAAQAPIAVEPTQPEKPMGMRERDTLLTIIIAMAIGKYGYKPGVRGSAVAEIESEIEKLGIDRLSDDTIRNKLKDASEILPGRTMKKLRGRSKPN